MKDIQVHYTAPSVSGKNEVVCVTVKGFSLSVLRATKADMKIVWRLKEPSTGSRHNVAKSLSKAYLQTRIPELEEAYQEYKKQKKH
ncbi:MAG: hypothetical protein JNL36_07745 [Candidatus Kapabacteria bacterium]|nr:hypothetical protein [Candidatus Kapabacteria bacterium]